MPTSGRAQRSRRARCSSAGRSVALLLLAWALPGCALSGAEPRAVDGRLDLSGWDFAAGGHVILEGEWSVCWGRLLEPGAACPGGWRTVAVRGLWTDRGVGSPFGGRGVATYRSVARYYRVWLPLQSLTLLAGFTTSVLAALMADAAFSEWGWGRVALIVLPALGSAASSIAVQGRLYERYQLRERGRVQVQGLCLEGRRRFAAAAAPADYTAIHADLERRLNAIEAEQGEGFFSSLRESPTT